jgi:hypothetical protein
LRALLYAFRFPIAIEDVAEAGSCARSLRGFASKCAIAVEEAGSCACSLMRFASKHPIAVEEAGSGAGLDIDNWVMAYRLEQVQKTRALRRVRGFLPGGFPVLNFDGGGSICHPVLHDAYVEFQKMICNWGPEPVIGAIAKVPVCDDAPEAGPGHPSPGDQSVLIGDVPENAKVFYSSSWQGERVGVVFLVDSFYYMKKNRSINRPKFNIFRAASVVARVDRLGVCCHLFLRRCDF